MSETVETVAAPVQDAPAAETTTQEPAATTAPETTAAEPSAQDAPKPGDEPWRKVRIEQITREKHEERRAREAAERELAEARRALEELRAGRDPDASKLNAAQIEAEARRIAMEELAAREQDAKNARFIKHGESIPDFNERCAVVASMGATSRPEFMQIIGDMDEAGPRVVMHLADNPTEAMRILQMPPAAMGRALAVLETQLRPSAPAPKETSKAPKPITPVGGATASSPDLFDPNISMREYIKLRDKQLKAREDARR